MSTMTLDTRRRTLARRLLGLAAAFAAATGMTLAGPSTPPAEAVTGTTLGDYGGAVMSGTNTIDIPATVSKLSQAHVNTYAYLVCWDDTTSQSQWNQLPSFLTAAAGAGIEVWVYMCPPSESANSDGSAGLGPYHWDYAAWGQAIGNLANSHPNLVAWAMDDFGYNTSSSYSAEFTPSYTASMVSAMKSARAAMRFYPVMYRHDVLGNTAELGPYKGIVDGLIFPYRNESGGKDTTSSANVSVELPDVWQVSACPGGSRCYQVSFPGDTPSGVNWIGGIEQTASVPAGGTKTLSFTYTDDYLGSTYGYRFVEVAVDGHPVWSEDVGGDRDQRRATVDLTSELAGKTSANIQLWVKDKQAVGNFHTTVTFDDVTTSGFSLTNGNFEGSGGWTTRQSSSAYSLGYANDLEVLTMVYAHKLSSEPNPPTAAYVSDVTDRALALPSYTEGVMQYVLNKTGSDLYVNGELKSYANVYPAVQSIYASH